MYSPPKSISNSRLPIIPRRVRLAYDALLGKDQLDPNQLLSSMVAALSGVFPPGEREFVRSVRLFLDDIQDEELLREVKAFAAQEGHHANQHRVANQILDQLGYSATKVAAILEERIEEIIADRDPRDRLAVTVVMEHYTASMAHFALSCPERLERLPPALRELMQWHAIEEIEHKSVAFDVYEHCVGERNRLRMWTLFQLVMFPIVISRFMAFILRERGHRVTLDELRDTAEFMLGDKGLMRVVLPLYLRMLERDFHPWDIDDSELVEAWKARLSAVIGDADAEGMVA